MFAEIANHVHLVYLSAFSVVGESDTEVDFGETPLYLGGVSALLDEPRDDIDSLANVLKPFVPALPDQIDNFADSDVRRGNISLEAWVLAVLLNEVPVIGECGFKQLLA